MSTKDITRRQAVLALMVFGLSAAQSQASRAELVLNFPLKGDARLSKEASSTLLYGATRLLGAIQLAELDREQAAAQAKEGVAILDKARQMFGELQKRVGSAPVDISKVTLRREEVSRILSMHKIAVPKTMDELSRLAMLEVNRFLEVAREMNFGSVQRARSATLQFSTAVNRLLDVGVLVSELAETAQ